MEKSEPCTVLGGVQTAVAATLSLIHQFLKELKCNYNMTQEFQILIYIQRTGSKERWSDDSWWRSYSILGENMISVPSTHVIWYTMDCDTSFRWTGALFWFLRTLPFMCVSTQTKTYTVFKNFLQEFKNYLNKWIS